MSLKITTTGIEVDGTTSLYIKNGNEAEGRILTSGSNGLVRWDDPKTLFGNSRYIGELYGGGIVVDVWQEGQDEKVLIASLTDVQIPYSVDGTFPYDVFDSIPKWSLNDTSLAGATSLYDGKYNTKLITTNVNSNVNNLGIATFAMVRGSGRWTTKAADGGYVETPFNGYSDWYLPSLNEMKSIYQSAGVINRVLGEDNFKVASRQTGSNAKYWTSTEISATNAWLLNLTTGYFENTVKTTTARVRYVRMESKLVGNGLIFSLDMSNKKSYNDLVRGNKVGDIVNAGATSSYAFQFQSTNAVGITYSTDNDGYLSFFGNQYIDFSAPIGTSTTLTVEMWVRLKPGSSNKVLFGWNEYCVYLPNGTLGYNTNNSDSYGISAAQVTSLGLFDNWAHYVFEMRTDVSYTNNKIYINGQLQTLSQQLGSEASGGRNFNSGNGRIGTHRLSTSYLNPMDLAVFRIYNRSLTIDEILKNYNSQKKKFDIGITNTHTIDPTSLSISQNLSLNITGKRNERILRADASGTASWVDKRYLFNKPDNDLNVGDIFGGGIIVSKWKYPSNVNRYLIMSTVDISTGSVWSNLSSDTSLTAGQIDTTFDTSATITSPYTIDCINTQSDGKILISGSFTTYKGVDRNNFARINRDGSLDTNFTCGFDGTAYAIEFQNDGKIILGGDFTNYYAIPNTTPGVVGIPVNKIIRLNADGTIDTSFWAGNSTGTNFGIVLGSVSAIKIVSDGIIVVGNFSNYKYNGTTQNANNIIKLNFDGTLNSTFVSNLGTSTSGGVSSIATQTDGKIVLGGYFTQFNGNNAFRIVRLNSNGTYDNTFTGGVSSGLDPNCSVSSLAIQSDGKIIIGGKFTSPSNNIARLTSTGANDTTFSASTDSDVVSILIFGGRIIIGGSFTLCNGTSASRLAVLQSTGARDTISLTLSWSTGSYASVSYLKAHPNGFAMVGGSFNRVNTSIIRSSIFGFYPVTTTISNDMPTGLTNDYNGATNSQNIISRPNHTTSAAKLCDDYTGGGFTDWYLPAIFELSQAYNSLSSTGYVLGKPFSGTYWSSTSSDIVAYQAYTFNIDASGNTGTQMRVAMSSSYKVRAFRQVAQLSNIQTWNKPNPWDDPDLSWEKSPGSDLWSTYTGVSTRNLVFHFNTNNLLSYKGSGTTAYNLIDNTSGTLLTGVTFSNTAILFNGTMSTTNFNTDSYIDFGTSTTANVSNSYPYTIESWINPTFGTASVNATRGILAVGVSTTLNSNYSGIDMVIGRNPDDTNTYKVIVNLGNNGGSSSGNRKSFTMNNYILQKGNWYHICVIINSISSFTFYINGSLYTDVAIDSTGTATSLVIPAGSKILIGQSSVYKRVFGGLISICRFYNTALTANEVKENFEFDRIKYGL